MSGAKELVERLPALAVWPRAIADSEADKLTPRQIEMLYAAHNAMHEAATLIERQEQAAGELARALERIASGESFREQRFAEDDDSEYFLRAQRNVQKHARTALREWRITEDTSHAD